MVQDLVLDNRYQSVVAVRPSRYAHKGITSSRAQLKKFIREECNGKKFIFSKVVRGDHKGLLACHKKAGGKQILILPQGIKYPDQQFAQDVVFVVKDLRDPEGNTYIIFLLPMGSIRGKSERKIWIKFFRKYGIPYIDLADLSKDIRIEGGDLIPISFTLLEYGVLMVGVGERTNMAGVELLRSLLKKYGWSVVEVPHNALHLSTVTSEALQPFPGGKINFLCKTAALQTCKIWDKVSDGLGIRRKCLEVIPINCRQSWGVNCIPFYPQDPKERHSVIIQSRHSIVRKSVEQIGFELVLETDFESISRINGSPTCNFLAGYKAFKSLAGRVKLQIDDSSMGFPMRSY